MGTRTALPPKGASRDGAVVCQSPEVPQCEAEEAKRLLLVNGDVRGQGTIGLGVLLPEASHLLLGCRSHRDNTAKEEGDRRCREMASILPLPAPPGFAAAAFHLTGCELLADLDYSSTKNGSSYARTWVRRGSLPALPSE